MPEILQLATDCFRWIVALSEAEWQWHQSRQPLGAPETVTLGPDGSPTPEHLARADARLAAWRHRINASKATVNEWREHVRHAAGPLMDAAGAPGVSLDYSPLRRLVEGFNDHAPSHPQLIEGAKDFLDRLARRTRGIAPPPEVAGQSAKSGVDDLVGLDEAAALVHRTKRTLERRLAAMPAPFIQGGGGKPSLWKWDELRPWLEREYVPDLPDRFPRNVR